MAAGAELAREAGALANNILVFGRLLRSAGLPVAPGSIIDAIEAVEVAGLSARADFYTALHSVFVKKHEDSVVFDRAFDLFWRRRGALDERPGSLPAADETEDGRDTKPAATRRLADAIEQPEPRNEPPRFEFDLRLTMSSDETLRRKDFAQMSAEELARAAAAIDHMRLPAAEITTRRFVADRRGRRIDPRRSFRRSLEAGGAGIELARRRQKTKHPPVVAIVDISGSMSDYTRTFLHFLHRLATVRKPVHVFLFGTRLTNVSRALANKDIDVALARCSTRVDDWAGGTRIATSLRAFNRSWARRVGQGAIVLLFTDGLERGAATDMADLAAETERLRKSCRRLIWVNPLLRYDRFEARAQGIRAMLAHVDELRPIHNLANVADLAAALNEGEGAMVKEPREWLRHSSG